MCSPQRDISNERLIVTRKTPPKIGKCVCFTLCWILLYRSWRISENTSAPTCKAVVRKSLAYVRSLWRTPCTKKMPLWMHMTPKRWCTGHSSARGRKKMTEFVQCPTFRKHRYGIDGVGLPPSHASCAELQQISPGSPGAPAPPAFQPSSSSQPTMSNTSMKHVPPQCVPQFLWPSSHTILGLTLSGTECSSSPRSPDPVHVVLEVSSAELYIWASQPVVLYNGWQTRAFPGHSSSRLKVNAYFRAFLKL